MNLFNELPIGVFGRHGYFSGGWSEHHARYMNEFKFPMVTLDGDWNDLLFLEGFGKSIRWLHIVNKKRRIEGIEHLQNLEILTVGFEPRNITPLFMLPKLKSLEIVSKDLGVLCSIDSLEKLKVTGAAIFGKNVLSKSLRQLELISPFPDVFESVGALESLESLSIFRAKELQSLDFLGNAKRLITFMAESCHDLINVDVLSSLESVQKISIVKCPVGELKRFCDGSSIKFLHIGGFPVRLKWGDLLSIRSLRRIAVYVCEDNSTEDEIVSSARSLNRSIEKLSIVGKKNKMVDIVLSS